MSSTSTSSSSLQVAFVGLGNMGAGMSASLAKKGISVTGFDLRPEPIEVLIKAGGQGAKSASEAARGKDVLVIMTINDAQAKSILFQAGTLEAVAQGAVVVVTSTISPEAAYALSEAVKKARPDVGFVDAPVSGGSPGADSGTLTIMAAGAKADYEKVKPVLDGMGTKVYHVGERPGQGESMKAINQVLCGVHLVAAAEALSLAKATGIDPALALEIVKGSAAGSWMLSNRAHRMLEEEPTCYSSVQTWAKDFGIILDTARQSGAHLPLSAIAGQMWNSAMGRGQATLDDTTVIRQYDFLNGIDVKKA